MKLQRARGASLVTAIFLLVMLTTLAGAMVTLVTNQQTSSALDVLGTRAYLAARAGVEWGVYQVTQAGGPCTTAASTTSTFALPADSTLATFSVTVVCRRTLDPLLGQARYTVTATSCNQVGAAGCPNPGTNTDYVQRVVNVEFSAPGVP